MNLFELFVKIGADTSQAEKGMKNTEKNSETLTNKIKVMSAQFEAAQKNVDKLTQEFNESVSKTGAASKETQELAKKLDDAEKEAEQARKALDGYNSELGETEVKAEKASGGLSNFASKLGKGLATAAKIGTAAVGAAAAGIIALTKSAVDNYAEYEQLVGGVDTLFKDASQKVQKYAADAYKTAGMSANDYMANATAFSASLISSLGGDTEKAAEYANRAMVSMSDNANKMGTSLDSIVQTYQSLSRGNMAMLDNLKLGYGGTKAELERLIADAASYTDIQKQMGITVDASSMSFDNIVNAIAVVQGKLGIAGATAAEAGTTIEGSVNSMKAAWTNLVTGFADKNADIESLIENLVTTIVGDGTESNLGVIGNVLPAVETALGGISKLIEGAAPKIIEILPGLVERVVPSVISAATGIVSDLAAVLPGLLSVVVDAIVQSAPSLITAAVGLVQSLLDTLVNSAIPSLLSGIESVFSILVTNLPSLVGSLTTSLSALLPLIIETAVSLVSNLASQLPSIIKPLLVNLPVIIKSVLSVVSESLPILVESVMGLVTELVKLMPDYLNVFLTLIPEIFGALVPALIDSLPVLLKGIGQLAIELYKQLPTILIAALLTSFPFAHIFLALYGILKHLIGEDLGEKILEFLGDAWENVSEFFSDVFDFAKTFVSNLIQAYVDAFGNMIAFYKELPGKIWNFLLDIISFVFDFRQKIIQAVLGIIKNIVSTAIENVKKFAEIGENIVSGIKEGIKSAWSNLKNWFENLFGDLIGIAKKILGIASPSKVFKKIGGFTAEGFGAGFEDEFAHVKDDMEDALNFDDASVGINASIRKVGAGAAGGAFGGTSIGNININIDGARYDNEQSLAEAVALAIQDMTDRRSAVYA